MDTHTHTPSHWLVGGWWARSCGDKGLGPGGLQEGFQPGKVELLVCLRMSLWDG